MQALNIIVLLCQPSSERVWMLHAAVIHAPKYPICSAADRVCHDVGNKPLEIRLRVPSDTVTVDFTGAGIESCLVGTAAVSFVLVFDTQWTARFRRTPMPGPGFDRRLLISTDDYVVLGEVFTVPRVVVQVQGLIAACLSQAATVEGEGHG